jgi:hypothetical protein
MTIVTSNGTSLGTITAGSINAWTVSTGGTFTTPQTMLAFAAASDPTMFPLAQDTAVFAAGVFPATGQTTTINAGYNIGTIDMSARTSNTMTLGIGTTTPTVYGNWINGTGSNNSTGTGTITFAGRGSQTLTSATKSFACFIVINTPSGSVTLQDQLTCTGASGGILNLTAGTFDANGFAVSLNSSGFSSTNSNVRTLAFGTGGSATWTIGGSGTAWTLATSTNLTVTGTATISMTSASAKSFSGGGIQTLPTLNQGGTGALTISGSNKFVAMTNTAIGSVIFTSGTTNEFTTFSLSGVLGTLLTLGATLTSQAILKKPTAWNVGANSTNGGNNTGLTFAAGGGIDYLSISYINGQLVTSPAGNGNFLVFF